MNFFERHKVFIIILADDHRVLLPGSTAENNYINAVYLPVRKNGNAIHNIDHISKLNNVYTKDIFPVS